MDAVFEVLSKPSAERTDEDIGKSCMLCELSCLLITLLLVQLANPVMAGKVFERIKLNKYC